MSESAGILRGAGPSRDAMHPDAQSLDTERFRRLFFSELEPVDTAGIAGEEAGLPGRFLPPEGPSLQEILPQEVLELDAETLATLADWLPEAAGAGGGEELREWLAAVLTLATPGRQGAEALAAPPATPRPPDALLQEQGAMARELARRAEFALRSDPATGDDRDGFPIRPESLPAGSSPGAPSGTPATIPVAQLQQLQRLVAQAATGTLSASEQFSTAARTSDQAPAESLLPNVLGTGQPTSLPAGADRGTAMHPALSLHTPLHQQQQWSEEVGNRIRWMAGNRVQSAELKLNPPQLGPIEVRVSVNKDQMNITFLSHHAQVREVLEETAPRLREIMNSQGFTSVNVDVSRDPDRNDAEAEMQAEAGDREEAGKDGAGDASGHRTGGTGIIDFYA